MDTPALTCRSLLSPRTGRRHERTISINRVAANNGDVQQSESSLDRSPVHHRTHTHTPTHVPHTPTPKGWENVFMDCGRKVEKTHTDVKRRGNSRTAKSHLEPYCHGNHAANDPDTNTGCKIKVQACRLLQSSERR